jgi:CubicO group peptidase (beta-lactamase class C family)
VTRLMDGFPPSPERQVTLANWRTSPFNRWAFHHVREIVPSADIPNDPADVMALPSSPVDVGAVSIESGRGEALSLDDFLDRGSTDGFVIVHRGRVVLERYAHGMTRETPHILMSVSKSLLGLLAGVLVGRGALRPDRPVTDVVPEVAGTAYEGATIRHLLDMRAGIAFDEDYLAASGPIVQYRKATGWWPLDPGEPPSDLRGFYRTLTGSAGAHGGPVHYVSPNTDLLGWVIERATGTRYADLMSELIWKPLGAERSAYITVDRLGAPRCAGGLCATVRDLARVGQLIVQGGGRGGASIAPEVWIQDIAENGDPGAWAAGDLAAYLPATPLSYRSQWYVRPGPAPVIFALGIHGQYLFVDRAHRIVVAIVSSQALPIDPEQMALTLHAVARITELLAASRS